MGRRRRHHHHQRHHHSSSSSSSSSRRRGRGRRGGRRRRGRRHHHHQRHRHSSSKCHLLSSTGRWVGGWVAHNYTITTVSFSGPYSETGMAYWGATLPGSA